MTDLSTTYLGLQLKNPIVASASPLSEKIEIAKQLEEAGISAIVMYSLFEEQIIHESLELDHFLFTGTEISPEITSFYPQTGRYSLKPDAYLEKVTQLKKAVSIPVIGSLNGVSTGGWVKYARRIEEAGADALELNLYYLPVDPNLTSSALEDNYIALVSEVCNSVRIPVSVKLSPYFTALPNVAKRMAAVGAKGLVLFNRFYQPDLDIENLEVLHTLELSTSSEMRLPLRWVSILYGKINIDLALTSGVHTAEDVIKAIMAGAKAVLLASALLKHGPGYVSSLLTDIQTWMEAHEYDSISQMQGSLSQAKVADPAAYERANYMKVLQSFRTLP
ncbi:MAG: dihydroorotate dehydrogenase-like protein [Anaerolineales bacterium]|nr:dihydroorotate dehydrogenase-like protein [Anaerolineales bacterium]MCX7607795.1 dihydroorotate dehydrogenase-like protein [Anaerolineales bacterium]MDW8226787.1 dihydroorotate dehydrogenase-like protein [Anaerolineales bacterium]